MKLNKGVSTILYTFCITSSLVGVFLASEPAARTHKCSLFGSVSVAAWYQTTWLSPYYPSTLPSRHLGKSKKSGWRRSQFRADGYRVTAPAAHVLCTSGRASYWGYIHSNLCPPLHIPPAAVSSPSHIVLHTQICMRVPPRYKAKSLIHLQPTSEIQAAQQARRQQRNTMTRTTHKAHPTPGFPVYCMDWADDQTVLLGGGGGASRSGIENKIVRLVFITWPRRQGRAAVIGSPGVLRHGGVG